MKILVINHEFPPIGGGAATVCRYIVKYLEKMDNKVEVVTSAFKGLPKEEVMDNYVIRRIFTYRREIHRGRVSEIFLFIINGMAFLLEKAKKDRPELILAFFTLPSGFLALLLKKIYKIPYFVFLRGMCVPGFYGGRFSFLNKVLRPIIQYIWVNADMIIANSQSLKELAFKTLKERTVYVLPNAVDIETFFPSRQTRIDKKLKLIFVGRLNKQKALNCLLDSIAIIIRDMPHSFILEIIGDGTQKNNLTKKSLMLKISNCVVFTGWIDRDNLLKKYQDADIFVTTSLAEGMSNSVLEAMACGLPIVASDISSHREIIKHGENGLLVPLKKPEILADAIKLLIKDEALRRKMGEENAQKIKNYSLQNISRYFQDLMVESKKF